MNKGLKIFLITIPLIVITIIASIFIAKKTEVVNAKKVIVENIQVGDNTKLSEADVVEQIIILNDDEIGVLTIPDILLENAPVKESTELSTLATAIGHFTNTSIYNGNVGLASHNGGDGDYFKDLNKLKVGNEIYYQTRFGVKRYLVKTIKIIAEDDWSYLGETEDNRITLITCVNGKPNKRLCVQAIESEDNMENNI